MIILCPHELQRIAYNNRGDRTYPCQRPQCVRRRETIPQLVDASRFPHGNTLKLTLAPQIDLALAAVRACAAFETPPSPEP